VQWSVEKPFDFAIQLRAQTTMLSKPISAV
jgi:hypothetical protein